MPNIFIANDLIPNKCSLYKESLIYNDNTQRVLLPYIKITEQIIRDVLRLYDAYAECNIFPSFDLGVPNNVIRLAGGFATGSIISWCSSIPFVPVDITLNVCSSSCYYIDNILAKTISEKLNEKRIIEMTLQGEKQGYRFSFTSGNHFIMLAKNRNNQYMLLLHSSDREYKTGNEALYPTVNSWFLNVTKRYVDSKYGRYLNYLIGEPAYKFQEIALKNNYKNNEIHSWIASYLCDFNVSGITYNHYGMPKENIVQIGTYLIGSQDTVPIFSRLGYPVAMFKPDPCMWGIKINNIKKHIIPHGWGQKIDDLVSIEVINNKLVIRQHSNYTQFAISEYSKLPDNLVQVRDFGEEFVCTPNWNNIISGVICDVFYPTHLYCRFGEYKYAE